MRVIKHEPNYSQTGCSFDGNLANFRRNLGNLIDSLSGASCNPRQQVTTCASKLVSSLTSWLRLVVIYKMFQVLLQYFEDRFASFYVEEPVNNYNELLDRVKKAIPVLRGVGNEQIVVSYKDVSLQTISTGMRLYMYWKPSETLRLAHQKFTDVSI